MKYLVRALCGTGVFAAAAAAAYWFVTDEIFGTVVLAIWSVSVLVAGIWLWRRGRAAEVRLAADTADVSHAAVAGEEVGRFQLESAYPLWFAAGVALTALGLVWSLYLAGCGVAVIGYVLWRLVRESPGANP